MRISEITNWAYAATVILTMVAGVSFILSERFAIGERASVEQHLSLSEWADQLELEASERTDEVRLYIMRGQEQHLEAFYVDENEVRDFEALAQSGRDRGASEEELDLLTKIADQAEVLDGMERQAISDFRGGRRDAAQRAIFGEGHYAAHSALLESVRQAQKRISDRTGRELAEAQEWADFFALLARIMLTATAGLFLGVLYFVLKKRIATPLVAMTGIVNRLANQDFGVEVPHLNRRDEIGEMTAAIEIFRANGLERERLDAELRRDQRIKNLILQMMHRLQACQALSEVADIITLYMPQIFPDLAGNLFVVDDVHRSLERRGSWHEPKEAMEGFLADQCWGLRRGRPHLSDPSDRDVVCSHLSHAESLSLCVPLTALGETVGLLHLESGEQGVLTSAHTYLELIAENLGLAIANLQLRDRLTGLAIRDPLTGLKNRRSLDEAINRLMRSEPERVRTCIMIDIDHFKRFNDEFGHEAGDAVIRHVAQILQSLTSGRGDVFRFGGEEFTILLEDAGEGEGAELGEILRARVAAAPLSDHGRFLGVVTISLGVASSPDQGPPATMLARADAALLAAKGAGRNRTIASSSLAG